MDLNELANKKINFYGSINNNNIYKNFWIMIIKYLPEENWFIVKRLNKSFYNLIKNMCVNYGIRTMASKI